MATSVDISVEAIAEHKLQEITLDGQEIYVQPLSMSENLAKLAQKIDFSKDESEEKGKPTSEGEVKEEEEIKKTVTPFQPSQWPWDSVRTKLKTALTEMSVLLDVLNITKERRYMVLDPVQQPQQDKQMTFHMIGKKRALQSAASILIGGGERLRKSQEMSAKRATPDFHLELFKLRQSWRLKKVGNTILGDLSYKSAGSRFWQSGTFEVTKSEPETIDLTESPVPLKQPRSTLQVNISSELQGTAYIQVTIKRLSDCTDLASVELDLPRSFRSSMRSDVHWVQKLEAAQNVIFCREVFAQLAREAVQIQSQIPHIVVGNQIFLHLFAGIQLTVALYHDTTKDGKEAAGSPSPKPDNNPVLEHSLHQLLRQVHFKNRNHPMPHPASALLGMSKRRRLAGPEAYTRSEILDSMLSESVLEQIIKHARHYVIRQKAIVVIDQLACSIQDPQLTVHWSTISSATEFTLKVFIATSGYENYKTPFVLHIGVDSMRAVCKDGKVIELSHEEQELRDLILYQIAQHHINTIHSIAKILGWKTLSLNTQVGVGSMEPMGNAFSIALTSPQGDRVLSIRSGPMSGMRVSVQKCQPGRDAALSSSSVVTNPKWALLGGPFQEVHLDHMEGRNNCHKIELLMACLGGVD